MKHVIIAGSLVLLAAVPALAQNNPDAPPPRQPGAPQITTPGVPDAGVAQGGSPDLANSGPASTGTVMRGPTGADNVSNHSASTSNAANPERPIPNTGGGGGDSGQ